MKYLAACVLVTIAIISPIAKAQEKKTEAPDRIDVAAEDQQAFTLAQMKIAIIEAQLKAARLEQENGILRAAIKNKVPADYYPVVGEDGRYYFQKPAPAKPETKPK